SSPTRKPRTDSGDGTSRAAAGAAVARRRARRADRVRIPEVYMAPGRKGKRGYNRGPGGGCMRLALALPLVPLLAARLLAAADDEGYAKKISEYTTDPMFLTEL